ncbi:MAG: DNA-directed RNA polymerase [Bogoriella megaspora]|nr:MAG: DNA-directed RNA polymerase [Bogoriella megaspora]
MLTRAARRRLRHDGNRPVIPAGFEQLRLPWLCPAIYGQRATATKSDASQPRKRRKSFEQPVAPSRRQSTIAQSSYYPDPNILYSLGTDNAAYKDASSSLTSLPPWDPQGFIHMDTSTSTPPQESRYSFGLGGSLPEMLQYMEACTRAGYDARAGKLLRRMEYIYGAGSTEVMQGQNVHLRELVRTSLRTSELDDWNKAQKYFEKHIESAGVEIETDTLAMLIKGALHALHGTSQERTERTIKRYVNIGDARKLEVLSSEIYNDEEYELLEQITTSGWKNDGAPDSEEIAQLVSRENNVQGQNSKTASVQGSDRLMPEIRPVELKGLGLKTLKQQLDSVSALENPEELMSQARAAVNNNDLVANERVAHQIMIEKNALSCATERWRVEAESMAKMGFSTALHTKSMAAKMWDWHLKLVPAIKEELEKVRESLTEQKPQSFDERLHYGPFLASVEPEKLSALTIVHTLSMLGVNGAATGLRLAAATKALGSQAEVESDLQALGSKDFRDQIQKLPGRAGNKLRMRLSLVKYQDHPDRAGKKIMKVAQHFREVPTSSSPAPELRWSPSVRVKVGAVLLSKLMEVAKIDVTREHPQTKKMLTESQPAFYHAYYYHQGRRLGRMATNAALVEQLSREPPAGALAKRLPMVVEPLPWSGYSQGGYYLQPTPVVRQKANDNIQRSYAVAAAEKGDMDQLFAGLDILGKTPWRINQDVLKVQLQAWDTGEAIASFAPEHPDLAAPPDPPADADRLTLVKYRKARERLENEQAGYHSVRCFQNFQLEVARTFRDQTLYFPHNVDFRGRAYPIPPYLNHMGADNARSLLTFAKGKELGEDGLRWLKIHLANVFGYDKASLQQREDFAMEHLPDIRDSVSNPLGGSKWWLQAEDPWQLLAACFEFTRALDSPDPTKFVSHLPIHQDGTCNGLQHYAALGGDKLGAAQVNLEPGDKPADIYSAVANMVREQTVKDADAGNEFAQMMREKITRKVVKQTVMTNVYGVTFVGAKEQVLRQLEDAIPDLKSQPILHSCAVYIARNIFKALSTMFKGAHDIQYWLAMCADRVSTSVTAEQVERYRKSLTGSLRPSTPTNGNKSYRPRRAKHVEEILAFKSSLVWTTPLRMPVVQPYRNCKAQQVSTTLQNISISEPSPWDPVSRRRQMAGFPPNFVHSLDATHMLLSALKCDEMGLSFAAVHDSFWTHAGDIPTMNQVLRDAFVRMHSEDIIGRLSAEFQARYKGGWYLASMYRKSEVGQKILAWRRATHRKSAGAEGAARREKELMMEYNRLKDLKSEDPEVRKRAEEMETPATIFAAQEGNRDAFLLKSDLAELGVIDNKLSRESTDHLVDEDDARVATSGMETMPEALPFGEEGFGEGDETAEVQHTALKPPEIKTTLIRKKQKPAPPKIQIWLPLTFPKVPEKGDFDVTRLRDSQYFFS